MKYTSKYTMDLHHFIYFSILRTPASVGTTRKGRWQFLETEVRIMANHRMRIAHGLFAAVMTLYAGPVWPGQEHPASFPSLQMSTQEALGNARFLQRNERSFFPQSSWELLPPRESESISFKHDHIAVYRQRAKSVFRPSPGGMINILSLIHISEPTRPY